MAGIAALDAEVPEVVYALLPAARGRGVATEAATCLSDWLLDHGRPVVALITVEGNVASERVAAGPASSSARRSAGIIGAGTCCCAAGPASGRADP